MIYNRCTVVENLDTSGSNSPMPVRQGSISPLLPFALDDDQKLTFEEEPICLNIKQGNQYNSTVWMENISSLSKIENYFQTIK